MKNKIVGIIGGLGPESTSDFYLELNRIAQDKGCSHRPSIIIDSLPVNFSIEEGFIKNGTGKNEYLQWLLEAIKRLEKVKVDFIVIPCNTVHIFLDELRKATTIPILSITEETAKACASKNFKKVGVLGTKLTMDNKLYDRELEKLGIEIIKPTEGEQEIIDDIIHKIVLGKAAEKEEDILRDLLQRLVERGAEAIVLGCTDLQILIKNPEVEVIDSMDTLAKATFERLYSRR
jgi:aspartate racemase